MNAYTLKLVVTVSLCLIAVFSSFMYVYAHTLQKSADDLVKIKMAEHYTEEACVTDGGKPVYDYSNTYAWCDRSEKK